MKNPRLRYSLLLCIFAIAVSPPVFSQTDATAQYKVTFKGNWNLTSTPGGVVGGAHFTSLIGATHNSSVSFWASGEQASAAWEQLAELGATSPVRRVMQASEHTDTIFTITGIRATGSGSTTIDVKRTHPLVTAGSMIGPSPDWFVGLSSYSLLDSDSNWVSSVTINLYPYDAGTEEGTGFSLTNPATSPQGVITSLRGEAPFSREPMAMITFERQEDTSDAPYIASIERVSDASQYTNADSVTWLVTFSEAVLNVFTDDFVVNGTTASVTSVSNPGSTTQYRVVASGGDLANLNGTISLGLSSAQNITNHSNVSLLATLPSTNETYIIDNAAPSVSSVGPASATGSPFTASITFNELIQAASFADVGDVTSDQANVSAPTVVGSSYQVTVTPTNPSRALTITLTIPAGAATDLAGNTSTAHQATIAYQPGTVISRPEVTRVVGVSSDGRYQTGDEIEIGITFSESVTVTGIPTLALQFDNGVRTARYVRGSGSTSIVFAYTLVEGDSTMDLGYTNTSALGLAGGSIVGSGGQAAILTLPPPGTSGSLSANSDIATMQRPVANPQTVVTDVAATTRDGRYLAGDQIEIGVTFSQSVTVTGTPTLALQFDNAVRNAAYARGSGSRSAMFVYTLADDDSTTDLGYVSTSALSLAGGTIVGSGGRAADLTLPLPGTAGSLRFNSQIAVGVPIVIGDEVPTFGISGIEDLVFKVDVPVREIVLPSATGGNGLLRYSIEPDLPEGIVIDLLSRTITGTPSELTSPTEYTWSVSDQDGDTDSLVFMITVLADLQPRFAADSRVADKVFIANSPVSAFTLPTATGGDGDLAYRLIPELPSGLTFDSATREVTGTPLEPKSETVYHWRVVDEDGDSDELEFSITILVDLQPAFDDDAAVVDRELIQNSPIESFKLPTAMGGNGSLMYSLTPELPLGLTLDAATQQITGSPEQPMSATTYVWMVVDEDGDTDELQFNLTVLEDLQPSFDESVQILDREYIQNSPIEAFTLPSAFSGNGTLTYFLTPELPAGLVLDLDTFQVSGTPTQTTEVTAFVWRAVDADGDEATVTFAIMVFEDLHPSFPDTTVIADREFIQDSPIKAFTLPTAMGGNGSLTYSLTPALPVGLMLDMETNQVSGTPEQPMSSSAYVWRVVDIDGDEQSLEFMLTVLEDLQPQFTIAELAETYLQNDPIEPLQLPSAEGGNGELAYELMPEPPAGLIFDASSRTVSGTPIEWQERTRYLWTVTDVDGDSVSISVYITVIEDLFPTFGEGVAIMEQAYITGSSIEPVQLPEAMGGNGLLSYQLKPELPSGLLLDLERRRFSGTPDLPLPRTSFDWIVSDADGDSSTLRFHLTVIQDTQPEFSDEVPDQIYIIESRIAPLTLPTAAGGNGEHRYSLEPDLPAGLSFDTTMHEISGTPTELMDPTTYSWTVEDVDGDTAELNFVIEVRPMPPMLVGSISPRVLYVGGTPSTVDVTSAVVGDIASWSFENENENVVGLTTPQPGQVVLTPRLEGTTRISVTASNISGTVNFGFMVTVATDATEDLQIDMALAESGQAILSSALNVFERRFVLHRNRSTGNSASVLTSDKRSISSASRAGWCTLCEKKQDHEASGFLLSLLPKDGFSNWQPMQFLSEFSHEAEKWSLWGSFNSENFSSGTTGNTIDGSLSSQYLGADWGLSDNLYTGLAIARHTSDTKYDFSSDLAAGSGSLDLSLTGVYPYLQARNGDSFAFYLVGGVGNGDASLNRQHVTSNDNQGDADFNLFAGGFEFLVLESNAFNVTLVGNAGSSTLSLSDDAGLLAQRETSSGKASLGGDFSFVQDLDEGNLISSVGLRASNSSGDGETGTGFEVVGSVGYWGTNVDLYFSGKMVASHSGNEVARNSLTARVRYKTTTDGTGLGISIEPSIGVDQFQQIGQLGYTEVDNLRQPHHALSLPLLKGEVSYGLLVGAHSILVTPRVSYQKSQSNLERITLGTYILPIERHRFRWDFNVQGIERERDRMLYGLNISLNSRL